MQKAGRRGVSVNVSPLAVLKKLHLIQADIDKMDKDGWNDFSKYKYLSETQITLKIKQLFDKHKVLFTYNEEIVDKYRDGTMLEVAVRVFYTFWDTESGSHYRGFVDGVARDKGDKAVWKAITGAVKYIYMKTFNIPTGDDAEKKGKGQAEGRVYLNKLKAELKGLGCKNQKEALAKLDEIGIKWTNFNQTEANAQTALVQLKQAKLKGDK